MKFLCHREQDRPPNERPITLEEAQAEWPEVYELARSDLGAQPVHASTVVSGDRFILLLWGKPFEAPLLFGDDEEGEYAGAALIAGELSAAEREGLIRASY